jgi:hypothetical protein
LGPPSITDSEDLRARIYCARQAKMSGRTNLLKMLKKPVEQWRIEGLKLAFLSRILGQKPHENA